MNEYVAMWRNYFNFSDRTSVRGYWMAFLFNIIAVAILTIISRILRTQLLSYLYSLAGLIPGIAITVRRLRDAGKHWAWIFITFVPIIGEIWLIILLCKRSMPYDGTPVV